ncbi:MAG: hypothetical protein EBV77_08930, partial [Gemmatimonadaceae bacterium]|nr:hypothetical protein [Gemmatimonadaceae bacterium]
TGIPLSDSGYQVEADESLLFFVEGPGDYFLRIGGEGDAPGGAYRFTPSFFALSAPGNEQEPNDLYADPLDSSPGALMQGVISKADDADWFFINTTEPAKIVFDVTLSSAPASGVSPLYLSVQSDTGEVLASRDVTAGTTGIEVELAYAGTVFLAVSQGETAFSGPIGYSVATHVTQSLVIPAEPSAPGEAPHDAVVEDIQTGADVSIALAPFGAGSYTLTVAPGPEADSPAQYFLKLDVPPTGFTGAAATWTGSGAGDRFPATQSAQTGADRLDGAGGDDQLDGGAGKDTAIFKVATSSLTIQSIAGLTAVSGDYDAGPYAFASARLWNIETIETLDGPIDLPASASINPLIGQEARDVPSESLKGGPDNDVIDARGGFDVVDGGPGNDTLVVFSKRTAFSVDTLAGITIIKDSAKAAELEANPYHNSHVVVTGAERVAFLPDTRDSRSDEVTHRSGARSVASAARYGHHRRDYRRAPCGPRQQATHPGQRKSHQQCPGRARIWNSRQSKRQCDSQFHA